MFKTPCHWCGTPTSHPFMCRKCRRRDNLSCLFYVIACAFWAFVLWAAMVAFIQN